MFIEQRLQNDYKATNNSKVLVVVSFGQPLLSTEIDACALPPPAVPRLWPGGLLDSPSDSDAVSPKAVHSTLNALPSPTADSRRLITPLSLPQLRIY